ncbi:DUF4920 domain-containing protein [Gramella sp. AN32]|uniref:DUF4920 domain-containing protein n=1 Tax=Christiangramia antarctica TaxID=2058158 RepID=A0ABW5X6Z2_9FLAO|nr:DUF4920 domain-containing protein [Gramella sp. AN32]MCM4158061.1 DUF4920 domain-containing protein [Gramella sp. AN32]
MKSILYFALIFFAISCNQNTESDKKDPAIEEKVQDGYESFGAKISPEGSFSSSIMLEKYGNLRSGDTIDEKFTTTVNSVCQMKGCWMVLELPGVDDAMVKFLDYGFFVPKDIVGKEIIVRGRAFVEEVSVEDQRHFAEDAGKSIDEIVAIREPKTSFGFIADGVLIKK